MSINLPDGALDEQNAPYNERLSESNYVKCIDCEYFIDDDWCNLEMAFTNKYEGCSAGVEK